jgi:hypothetical protein
VLGIRNLSLDDRVEDRAEGRQLGKGRAPFRRGGEGRQRLQFTRLPKTRY